MHLLFPNYVWQVRTTGNKVFLTFDDGPHPKITPWVLQLLKQYNAAATFFCIGNNVKKFPGIYRQILAEGHAVGNHTQQHLNGWKTDTETYLHDIKEAAQSINSFLFRPPYGRIKSKQAKGLSQAMGVSQPRVIMWNVLSADFDTSISKEECLANVLTHIQPGAIVVFHDSEKAFPHLQFVLPLVLKKLSEANYVFEKLGEETLLNN